MNCRRRARCSSYRFWLHVPEYLNAAILRADFLIVTVDPAARAAFHRVLGGHHETDDPLVAGSFLADRSRHGDLLLRTAFLIDRRHRNGLSRPILAGDILVESPKGDVAGLRKIGFHRGLGDNARLILPQFKPAFLLQDRVLRSFHPTPVLPSEDAQDHRFIDNNTPMHATDRLQFNNMVTPENSNCSSGTARKSDTLTL